MATYEKLSWQTIELPVVSGDTYFIVYDHLASNPGEDQTGIIYSGLVLDGYSIAGINEVLSQYVYPQDISFTASGYTQVYTGMHKTFYIYYTVDDWETYSSDIIIITYDWSYTTSPKANLSIPINSLVDERQFIVCSKKAATPDISTTIIVSVNGTSQDSFSISGYNTYTYVRKIPTFSYSGDLVSVSVGNQTYYAAKTCNRYCLYYSNNIGGWDSLLFGGKELQTDKLSRLSYKKNYRAMTQEFFKVDYLTTINESWQLNTSWLDDSQSSRMISLLSSNKIYLHDLEADTIVPVNITNSSCEHKDFKNQGRKLYSYTIEVEASQPKYRV